MGTSHSKRNINAKLQYGGKMGENRTTCSSEGKTNKLSDSTNKPRSQTTNFYTSNHQTQFNTQYYQNPKYPNPNPKNKNKNKKLVPSPTINHHRKSQSENKYISTNNKYKYNQQLSNNTLTHLENISRFDSTEKLSLKINSRIIGKSISFIDNNQSSNINTHRTSILNTINNKPLPLKSNKAHKKVYKIHNYGKFRKEDKNNQRNSNTNDKNNKINKQAVYLYSQHPFLHNSNNKQNQPSPIPKSSKPAKQQILKPITQSQPFKIQYQYYGLYGNQHGSIY